MNFENKEWAYSYRVLDTLSDPKKVSKITGGILTQFSLLTKSWGESLNSAWTCRIYFATNMILNATVLLKSAEYSEEMNLRIVRPYLEYYAVLSLLRCVVYTLPDQLWDNGKLIEISHTKAINLASNWLAKFCPKEAEKLKGACKLLKAQRELISYRAPASGDSNLDNNYDVIQICTILAELAQFNSELLEVSVNKNVDPKNFVVHTNDIEKITNVEIEGYRFKDQYDSMRLDYVRRKQPQPLNLGLFMTEGQTEDFIGAWDDYDNEDPVIYHGGGPYSWQSIFDIP